MNAESASLKQNLAQIVGEAHVRPGVIADSIDGVVPKAVVFPQDADEIAQILAFAHRNGFTVAPRGGGTQSDLGEPTKSLDIVLSLRRLDQLVVYEPADMTITVQAGMPLARLQNILRSQGQFLPHDPALPAEATVGGSLSTRQSGPLLGTFRSLAEHLLGVTFVMPDGKIAKSGGRVVKNVSGYELGRILTGSLGTLAVIVEATFKVQPLYETGKCLIARFPSAEEARKPLSAVLRSHASPLIAELLGPVSDSVVGSLFRHTADDEEESLGGAVLVLGFAGNSAGVDWQLETAREIIKREASSADFSVSEALPWDDVHSAVLKAHRLDADPSVFYGTLSDGSRNGQQLGDRLASEHGPVGRSPGVEQSGTEQLESVADQVSYQVVDDVHGEITFRVRMLPTDLGLYIDRALRSAAEQGVGLRFAAHAAAGLCRFHLYSSKSGSVTDDMASSQTGNHRVDRSDLVALLRSLRQWAEQSQGHLVIERADRKLKDELGVWGSARDDFFLHQAVKDRLDPKGVLNPGRFLSGI